MIPAGYRCLECEGYTSADDATSTGHYDGCQQPIRDQAESNRRWCDQLEALIPPTPVSSVEPAVAAWERVNAESHKNQAPINIETPWIRVQPRVGSAKAQNIVGVYGDEWSGRRKIDPQLNPLSVACHAEIVRVMQERVEAEERWIEGILASRGMKIDADSAARCLLETRTEHLLTGLRYEAVLKIDGYAVDPPFVYTLTYTVEPTP